RADAVGAQLDGGFDFADAGVADGVVHVGARVVGDAHAPVVDRVNRAIIQMSGMSENGAWREDAGPGQSADDARTAKPLLTILLITRILRDVDMDTRFEF